MEGAASWILGRVYTKKTMEGAGAIKGDKGEKGDTGERGIQGPKGDTGDSYTITSADYNAIADIVVTKLSNAESVSV